jgi:succinate dehydrogenase/fumarate reductase-like Fe-S protein
MFGLMRARSSAKLWAHRAQVCVGANWREVTDQHLRMEVAGSKERVLPWAQPATESLERRERMTRGQLQTGRYEHMYACMKAGTMMYTETQIQKRGNYTDTQMYRPTYREKVGWTDGSKYGSIGRCI